jgi:hypothetical protein
MRQITIRARAEIARLGVPLNKTHDFDFMIRECEWLASRDHEAFYAPGQSDADIIRYSHAMFYLEQLERIGNTLRTIDRIVNFERHLEYLRKRINRLHTAADKFKPQDFLFEAEVGSKLARWPDLSISFEEPDLVLQVENGPRLLIACKRPRSLKSLPANINRAASQIDDVGATKPGVGILMMGMEPIFHLSNNPGKPFKVLTARTEGEGLEYGSRIIDEAAEVAMGAQERAFNGRSAGVLYWGPWVFACDEGGGTLRTVNLRKRVFNSAFPGSQHLMQELDRRMFDAVSPPGLTL